MKLASLDLGSNTFLCLVSEIQNQKVTKIYSDEVEMVRLGQGLSASKKFHPEALVRAKNTLTNFRKTLDREKPEAILAMATSAARDAENKEELFKICQDLNIPLEIIPGEKEAEITYRGGVSGLTSTGSRLVVDIGGGSTEFIFGEDQKILAGKSLDIGCVRLTEKFISLQPTPQTEIDKLQNFIREQLQQIIKLAPQMPKEILAVAGTPTTIAQVELGGFDPAKIDGYKLTEQGLQKWLTQLTGMSVAEKIAIGYPEGRADVIIVGVITLLETLKAFNLKELTVSTRGVRYGVALELAKRFNT
ncbi:Ppx/GppA family phosphatase [Pseudobdellovibrio sp. HCB154]|uniref:Ppx/GppA phosphatase family protein n=1 Tax=Pseudobdellovibrio sp. HCB154 TaxID=3386277 RepID=UPI0039173538